MRTLVDVTSPADPVAGQRAPVDVVVPFVGSDDALAVVAERLNRLQTVPGDTLTIADNRPTAAHEPLALGATVVRHAAGRPTSYFARNRGAEYGTNPWIVFLDADVDPSPDVIDRYFDEPTDADVGVLGGGIYDDEPGPTAAERYSFHRGALGHANTITRESFAFAQTANAAVRRAAFEAVGGFREEIRSGGDADLCFRLRAEGFSLEPRVEAKVTHHNRTSVKSFFRQYARYGSGSAWLQSQYPGFSPRPNPLRVLRGILGSLVRAVLAAIRRDVVDAQVRMMDAVENTASFVGRFASNIVPQVEVDRGGAVPPGLTPPGATPTRDEART